MEQERRMILYELEGGMVLYGTGVRDGIIWNGRER